MFINTRNLNKEEFEKVILNKLVPKMQRVEDEGYYVCCIINDDLDFYISTRCDECGGLRDIEGYGNVFSIPEEVKNKFKTVDEFVFYVEEITGFDTFDCSYQDSCSCDFDD